MANRPASICGVCRATVLDGGRWCPSHLRDNPETRAAAEREVVRRELGLKSLYDSRQWRGIARPFILARDPLCRLKLLCEGMAASKDVDHIVRAEVYIAQHDGDETWFYDPDNLRGCCHACHASKTALENAGLWKEAS